MIQTAAGITLPFPEQIEERFVREGDTITLNLSFEKLPAFLADFYAMLREPLFLAIHPDAETDEVWYLDGMTKKQLTTVLDGYGELLYQDGLSAFAIASHETEEELFVQKYKVLSLYSPQIDRFAPMLEKYGVLQTNALVTPWDTFSEEHPGEARRLEIAGVTVPDMIRALTEIGMYRAN